MDHLINCENCSGCISVTAMQCPLCGKDRQLEMKESIQKSALKNALGASLILLLGPAALAAGIMGVAASAYSNKGLKKIARELHAIDSIILDDFVILVTEKEFVAVSLFGGASAYPGFPRDGITDLHLSMERGLLSRVTQCLFIKYYWPHGKRIVSEKYKFKGKHASELASLAYSKFEEYRQGVSK